jgi:hypothetical protein
VRKHPEDLVAQSDADIDMESGEEEVVYVTGSKREAQSLKKLQTCPESCYEYSEDDSDYYDRKDIFDEYPDGEVTTETDENDEFEKRIPKHRIKKDRKFKEPIIEEAEEEEDSKDMEYGEKEFIGENGVEKKLTGNSGLESSGSFELIEGASKNGGSQENTIENIVSDLGEVKSGEKTNWDKVFEKKSKGFFGDCAENEDGPFFKKQEVFFVAKKKDGFFDDKEKTSQNGFFSGFGDRKNKDGPSGFFSQK